MLEQLVESKANGSENARRGKYLIVTFTVLAATLMSGWTYSLFAKNYGVGNGDFDMASLVSPVMIEENAPPPAPPKQQNSAKTSSKKVMLEEIYTDLGRDIPQSTEGKKNVIPVSAFGLKNVVRGDRNEIPEGAGRTSEPGDGQTGGLTDDRDRKPVVDEDLGEVKPKAKPTPAADPKPTRPISLGPVNGKATYLPVPVYSPAAQAVRASGQVQVEVTIDETGRVISAAAISGHPLLRQNAVNAARISKFTPTTLSKVPVKVTGIIIYNFVPR